MPTEAVTSGNPTRRASGGYTDHLVDQQGRRRHRGSGAVCRDGSPVTGGKAASDPSQPIHITMEEMAERINVSPATLHAKAKVIRDSLDIRLMDPRFSTKG